MSSRPANPRLPPRVWKRHPDGPCCCLCGHHPLPPRRRSWCSDDCVHLWNLATSGEVARRHLLQVFGHRCWSCDADWRLGLTDDHDQFGSVWGGRPLGSIRGPSGGWRDRQPAPEGWIHPTYCEWPGPVLGPPSPLRVELEVEHVRPLWSLDEVERLELRWWLPFNLQLLCVPCHRAKTKREAGARAAYRRTGVLDLSHVEQPALL